VQLVNQVTGKAGQGAKGAECPPWAPIRLTQQLGLSSMVCGVPAGGWASGCGFARRGNMSWLPGSGRSELDMCGLARHRWSGRLIPERSACPVTR
jgi:hypothetical protein